MLIRKVIASALLFLWGAASALGQTAFGISPNAAKSLAVTTSSANVQLGAFGNTVLITNTGAVNAFVAFGAASNTAATTDGHSIVAGQCIVFNAPASSYVAAITAASSTTLKITQGVGGTACGVGSSGSSTVTGTVSATQGTSPWVVAGTVNVTPVDCSGAVTAGGTAQNAFTAQAAMRGMTIANIDTTEVLWISITGTATANAVGSFPLAPASPTTFAGMSSFATPLGFGFNTALSVLGATTGHKWSCIRW